MFGLFIDKIRVDLGEETFVDGDPTNVPIITDETIDGIFNATAKYIKSKQGELIDFNSTEGTFTIDTPDLTLECKVEHCDRDLTKEEKETFIKTFEKTIKG